MRILLAPNAFKGTFSAVRVAEVWDAALREDPSVETIVRPLSDGGDGALEVWERLLEATADGGDGMAHDSHGVDAIWFVARDPLGRARRVRVLWRAADRAGFVESALASGIALVPAEARDPLVATSRGTGQLLRGLLTMGAQEVTIGLGGSATVDGGLGVGLALGYRFLDASGAEIEHPADLPRLERIAPPADRPWESARVRALCDVRNPLLGPSGAARVFGPQKFRPGEGDLDARLERLERGLARLARRISEDLGVDVDSGLGFGAAGGLGAGLTAFAGARLESGSEYFLRLAGVPDLLRGDGGGRVDAAITGEGSYDAQSEQGKIAGELVRLCESARVPLAIVAGRAPDVSGENVLTGEAIGAGPGELDEDALAALAVEAVRRLERRVSARDG